MCSWNMVIENFKARIKSIGGSLYIHLPIEQAHIDGIKSGDVVLVSLDKISDGEIKKKK